MKTKLLDFIDFEKINLLLEGFNKATGFVTAILDLDGNILSKSGWRQVCTEFHRVNPQSARNCTVSDTELARNLEEGKSYHSYKCLNGLIDVSVPISVNNEHVANLFTGQFFYERPDLNFFKKQAEKHKFDSKSYLEAIEKVPVFSEEKVKIAMDFLLNMTNLINEMTHQKLEQQNLNRSIRESEEKFKSVFESANVGKSITLPTGEIYVNKTFCKMLGYTLEELQNKKWQDITPEDEISIIQDKMELLLRGKVDSDRFEKSYICKNGTQLFADVSTSALYDNKGKILHFITTIIDISEHKQAEKKLELNQYYLTKAQEMGSIGTWELNLIENKLFWTDQNYLNFGIPIGTPLTYDLFLDCIHPDDRDYVNKQWTAALKGEGYDIEHRLIVKNKVKWMREKADIKYDANGNPVSAIGFSLDITKSKQYEKILIKKMNEMQRFHNLSVDREFTMIELKKEVNELLKKSGLDEKYTIVG